MQSVDLRVSMHILRISLLATTCSAFMNSVSRALPSSWLIVFYSSGCVYSSCSSSFISHHTYTYIQCWQIHQDAMAAQIQSTELQNYWLSSFQPISVFMHGATWDSSPSVEVTWCTWIVMNMIIHTKDCMPTASCQTNTGVHLPSHVHLTCSTWMFCQPWRNVMWLSTIRDVIMEKSI